LGYDPAHLQYPVHHGRRMSTFLGLFSLCVGCGMGLALAGCSGDRPLIRTLFDHPERTIGLEVTYREGDLEFSHPANIPPDTLSQVLKHIQVLPSSLLSQLTGGSSTQQPAFTEEQEGFFSDQISHALAKASPLETATFFWSVPRGNGIWEITSGGVCIRQNDLHMHLANYRQTIASQELPPHLKLHPLIPLEDPLHTLKSTPPVQEISQKLTAIFLGGQSPHFIFPLQASATLSPHTSEPSERLPNQAQETGVMKHRLRLLEDLRKDGLLTEDEYQSKRKEILGEL